jgi:hypothetical protein
MHDGVVDTINAKIDVETKELTFETDRFSTYAIVYKDTAVKTTEKDDVPKMGDSFVGYGLLAVAMTSGVAFVVTRKKEEI